jgi:ribosomal protein L37E
VETLRTPEELNNQDLNYYFAYVIDPAEKDAKKIETAMATRKNSFTQGTVVQRRLKDLYTEAVKVMTTQTLRDEEFQAAKKFKLETAEKAIVAIVRGRGAIYKSDLIKMADASGKWLTADEIEKKVAYLLQQGAKLVDDIKRSLDFLTYDKIEKFLKTIGKNNLYDLLSTAQSATVSALQSAVTTVYNTVSGKTDPKSTATNGVCGEAKKIFKDDNSKKFYDVYLTTKDIWEEFALRRSTGISEMELKEFLAYSEKAKNALKALNINDVDYIEVLLAEGLNYFRIAVAGGEERGIDLENCPYCGMAYANNNNPKACPHCHQPLEIVCWNCGGKAPYTVKKNTCPSCGAAKEHNARFETIVKKIESLFVQPDVSITDIKTELNNLKNLLPDYAKASSSKLAKKVAEYQEKIDKKDREEETVGKAYTEEYEKIQELINFKKYISASGAVTALKNKYPKYNISKTDALSATISSVVLKVKQHADKAKTFTDQNNEEAAVSEIAAALDLSTDYIEANQIISKFPPKAPESVTAKIKDNSALITWVQNKPQKLATYTVIRKNGSRPTSITDGVVVASELSINFFEDKTIVSDTPYYYAVFSSRLGINSQVVFTTASVITYFDITNIRQEIVSGKIVVKWELPLNVSEVEVIRKKGLTPPTGREDGQKIPVKGNESFEDGDYDKLGNSYLFVCVYKNDKGVTYSKGITRTFKAFEELKPLTNVKIEQNGTTLFTLICDKITSGKRGLYYSTQEINYKTGSTLQIAEFKNFYKGMNEASLLVSDDNTATFNLPPDKAYYVYPAVCNEQLLIVSKPVIVNTMIGISQISYSESSNEVVITGRTHQFTKNVIAKVSNTAFPVTLNSDGVSLSVIKDDFVNKGLSVKLKANSDSYITIFVETESEGIKSTTCGVRLGNVISQKEKTTVRYVMTVNVSATKSFPIKIDFQSDTPQTIPELMLVKGSPRPLSKNEGQLVDRMPALTLKKGILSGGKYSASVTIKSPPVAVNTKFAIYPVAENKFIAFKEVKSL